MSFQASSFFLTWYAPLVSSFFFIVDTHPLLTAVTVSVTRAVTVIAPCSANQIATQSPLEELILVPGQRSSLLGTKPVLSNCINKHTPTTPHPPPCMGRTWNLLNSLYCSRDNWIYIVIRPQWFFLSLFVIFFVSFPALFDDVFSLVWIRGIRRSTWGLLWAFALEEYKK